MLRIENSTPADPWKDLTYKDGMGTGRRDMELMIAFREMVLPFPGTPCMIMPRFHGTESFL